MKERKILLSSVKILVATNLLLSVGRGVSKEIKVFTNFTRKLREESVEYEEILRDARRDEEIRAHQTGDELGPDLYWQLP